MRGRHVDRSAAHPILAAWLLGASLACTVTAFALDALGHPSYRWLLGTLAVAFACLMFVALLPGKPASRVYHPSPDFPDDREELYGGES